ncbi:MAG: hypothetical protein D6723_17015 [Acidobacteria bacterium]|nr:MAG: hypothetical protein D6723_17015 [Acidobacteriota bacterium]
MTLAMRDDLHRSAIRSWRWALIIALVGALWFPAPERAQNAVPPDALISVGSFAPLPPPPAPEQLRLVTYNLHGPPMERIDDIIDLLEHHPALSEATILGLQEVNRHHRQTAYKDMARLLASVLKMYYAYAVELPYKHGGGERGLALLSRFPMTEIERLVLPHKGPGGRRRIALGATIHLGERRLRVYTLHLETRLSASKRGDQIAAVLEHADRYRDLPTVIMGDFNTVTGGARKKMIALMTAAGFTSALPGKTMTFQRMGFIRFTLDWIWVRHVNVVAAKVEKTITASDHRPVWALVDLRSPSGDHPPHSPRDEFQ